MILCIGTTPAAQRVMVFRKLALDHVNRAATTLDGAAGKSINVAKVLKALGEHPVAMGFLGGDRGDELRRVLAGKQIESDFVPVRPRSRQCITLVDEATGHVTELVEESCPVDAEDFTRLEAAIRRRLDGCRAVVLSGTITPGGPTDFYARIVTMARQAGALSIVDAQGAVLLAALQAGPDLAKPNRAELAATLGRELQDEAAVVAALQHLRGLGTRSVVATAGDQPTLAFDGQQLWRVRPPTIRAVNPIGSGDAFTAGLIWRRLHGDHLGEACRWGAAAGAANALTLMPGELEADTVHRLAANASVERL